MKNVTISLDDELHRKSRVRAAEAGLSMSRYMASLLERDIAATVATSEEEKLRRLEKRRSASCPALSSKFPRTAGCRRPTSAMRAASVFIDANVFLYARDHRDVGHRGRIAADWTRRLLMAERGRTNLQVLNQVTHVMLRKRRDLTMEQIFEEIDGLVVFGISPIDQVTIAAARLLRTRYRYAWWDCLLLAAASSSAARISSPKTCRMASVSRLWRIRA